MSLYKRLHGGDDQPSGMIGFASSNEAELERRHEIDEGSRINGGVYRSLFIESIVVDDEKQPMLKQTYGMLRDKLIREHIPRQHQAIIDDELRFKPVTTFDPMTAAIEAYRYTQVLIPTSEEFAAALAASRTGEKIALTAVYGQGGSSRHQALNSAYFIEKMIDDDLLTGAVGIEKSIFGDEARVRYTPQHGETIIIDTTANFVGPVSLSDLL